MQVSRQTRHILSSSCQVRSFSGAVTDIVSQEEIQKRLSLLRPTRATIDLDALEYNLRSFHRHLRRTNECTRPILLPVVKANGYGHGALPLTLRSLQLQDDHGQNLVAGVAVATLEEAVLLREQLDQLDITCPLLLLLGVLPAGAEEVVAQRGITPSVCTIDSLRRCIEVAKKLESPMKIHLKLDTGMHRVGFMENELVDALDELASAVQENLIQVEGVYTHLSKADEEDKDYTLNQLRCFQRGVENIRAKEINPPLIHSMNSAGSIDYDLLEGGSSFRRELNLFRVGISLYGLYPSDDVGQDNVPCKPLMRWETQVVQVKSLDKSTKVGYGGTYVTPGEKTVVVLPVGYADGYRRLLGRSDAKEAYKVEIKGKKCPIVGRVCMDMIMVDASEIDDVQEGDPAVLMGDEELHCDRMAERLETINYEITCLVGERVPRVYLKDGETVGLSSLYGNLVTNDLLKKED